MKILHIHWRYDEYGGGERYLHALCEAQKAAGHDIVVLTSTVWPGHSLHGEKVYAIESSIGVRSGNRLKASVIKLIEDNSPDIVHLHHVHGFLSPLIVRAIRERRPTVQTVHDAGLVCFHNGKESLKIYKDGICQFRMGVGCSLRGCFPVLKEGLGPMLHAQWAMSIAKTLDNLLVASRYMKTELLRNGFLDRRIIVLPLFYDYRRGVNDSELQNHLQEPLLLYVGRVDTVKGVKQFIQALHSIREKRWSAEVVGDGSFLREAQDLVRELALETRIVFRGRLSHQAVQARYKDAYAVVMPSMIPESFGLVGIEAMACGKPVIGFDCGAIGEWLIDKETGFLVERGSVEGLAEKMSRLLDDASLARCLGARGQERVERHYREDVHIAKLLAVYEGAIHARSRKEGLA